MSETPKPENISSLVIGSTIFAYFLFLIIYGLVVFRLGKPGEFGDMFGAFNAGVTGLALLAVGYSIYLQNLQLQKNVESLDLQKDELRLQRKEMKEAREVLTKTSEIHEKQLQLEDQSIRLRDLEMQLDINSKLAEHEVKHIHLRHWYFLDSYKYRDPGTDKTLVDFMPVEAMTESRIDALIDELNEKILEAKKNGHTNIDGSYRQYDSINDVECLIRNLEDYLAYRKAQRQALEELKTLKGFFE